MLNENLIEIYEKSFRENREMTALSDYFKKESFSYYQMAKEIAKLHLLFAKAGIKQGDKIALIGRNNPRWCISYLATITFGAVIVPILQDFNPNDIIHIINHSESKLLFLGDNFWDIMDEEQVRGVQAVFSLSDFSVIYERSGLSLTKYQANIQKHYRTKYNKGFGANHIKYPKLEPDHVCLLNYTSGTTGYSKGVILTLNNLCGNIIIARDYINVDTKEPYFHRGGRVLSFLPLAHAYGCAFDFLTQMAVGGHVTLLGKIPSPKILIEAMQEVRPTLVCCVPLILEKIYRKQILPILERGSMSVAMKIPFINSAIYSAIKKRMIDTFGGEVQVFIVGGAPLNQETEAFLMKIGFPITVGYGMTECAPLITFTGHDKFKPRSCGQVIINHLEVIIDSPDPQKQAGEVWVRGEHVMQGYYKNEADTNAVLDKDGWLHTGDMATIDEDNMLYISGRSKTMILSSNGQNVYPEQIEARLNNMYLVTESLIIEDDGKLAALVVPDLEQADLEGVNSEKLKEIMENNMRELNESVAAYERIASISIFPSEFQKTPKRSIKRYLYDRSLLTTLK